MASWRRSTADNPSEGYGGGRLEPAKKRNHTIRATTASATEIDMKVASTGWGCRVEASAPTDRIHAQPPRFLRHDMFESARRWTGQEIPDGEVPLDATIGAMDAAGVDLGLISAWHGPEGTLISNDEVAGFVAEHPDRLAGLAAVDLQRP